MFVDTAKVLIVAGKGGDGGLSFRHEKYVDKGGPDGGDGGKGGDVVFVAAQNANTLVDFRYNPELKAEPGQAGSKRDRHGRSGEDLEVKVPVGTMIFQESELIADLVSVGQKVVVAKGGGGGFGNAHFKSSVRQAPRIAEKGEPGDTLEADLELKLLADVGLVGFPNAGKSTFLSVVSNARPKVAAYEFTTLTPNLGVAEVDGDGVLIADIPGLIEGASEGKGLGDEFLRHVERTSVLLHLIDIYQDDIADAYKTIRGELKKYSSELVQRPEVIALTKAEGLDEDVVKMQVDAVKAIAKDAEILVISSQAHLGLTEVLRSLKAKVSAAREVIEEEERDTLPVIQLSDSQKDDSWTVEKLEEDVYLVRGKKIERFAVRTDLDNYEAVNRLRDIINKMGIAHELSRQGANGESVIRIGSSELTLVEQ
jgi:GTP-binding protein